MTPQTQSWTKASLLFLFLFFFTIDLRAQTFVRSNATGANNGTSWADAYTNLNIALSNTLSGQVWVAAGTYRPVTCNPCSDAQRQIFFELLPDVQLYGGFAGTETALNQRDYENNLTILSGDIGVANDSTDNSYKIVYTRNSTTNTIIDGFIIEEGNADGSFGFSSGGGIFIDANDSATGDLQVRNCTIRNNYAGGGGGVAIDCVLGGTSNALFRNCLFEGNTASLQVVSTGAAIFMQGNSGASLTPRIVSCIFRDNFCGNDGGAFSATPTGAGTTLAFVIDSCLFENNRAFDRGAAVWYRMASDGESAVMIKNSRFIGNQAGGQGGAIFARSSFNNIANDTILNCIFSQNSTDGSSTINDGEGGAIFLRASQDGTRNQHIINCVFDRNFANERGGAIGTVSFVSGAGNLTTDIVNCSFYGNRTAGDGGAINVEGSDGINSVSITNSILWRDSTNTFANEFFNNGGSITVAYSNVDGGIPIGVTDGGNNLDVDPMFVDAPNGDLHLPGCSPLINIGNNAAIPTAVITDADGDDRIYQSVVDLGAYEIGRIYVDLTATGANNGRSWNDAFTDFQDALAVGGGGDQIWVAQGTYRPISCAPCDDADRQVSFNLPSDVEAYGGFNGTETQLSQRDWENNPTILSGDIGTAIDSTDNSYTVVYAQNVSEKTILDGFIIEEGNADGSFGVSSGGGIFIDANPGGVGDLQVQNCTIRNNYAGGGGGVAIDCVLGGRSNALFRNCLFEGNTASLQVVSTGAAIFMQGNSGASLTPRIVSSTFRDNFCGNDGGAFSATPTGAGTILAFEIDSCLFENNRASDRGAAVWYRMSSEGESNCVIQNSRFINNTSGGQGAAIYARSSFNNIANDTIINCFFSGNSTDGSSTINEGEGGAIFLRGSQDGTRNQEIINCVFANNSASERGGAIATSSLVAAAGTLNANIINCTFYGNSTNGDGGAIHAEGSEGVNNTTIVNSILWNDSAVNQGQELFSNGATVTVSYSDIQGGIPSGITDGGNNIDVDPQFLDEANEDFHLSACSPAVDTGFNEAIPLDLIDIDYDTITNEPIEIDLDHAMRIFGSTIDLGAYEWNGDPAILTIEVEGVDVSCSGQDDGSATVTASEGLPDYTYNWSTNESTPTISNLSPGIYYVTVEDAGSCLLTDSIVIAESALLSITTSPDTSICLGESLTIMAAGEGGSGNFTYNWDNDLGTGDTQEVMPETTTTYTVSVLDENNCPGEDSLTVTVLPNPEVQISGSATICPGGMTTLEGTAGFDEYLWSDNTTNASLEVATPGIYSLTVTDENGCMGNAEIEVIEDQALQPNIVGELAFCEGQNTILDAGVFDNYNWSNGDTTQTITVDAAGEYFVVVSDGSGCEGMDTVSVAVNPNPEVQISGSATICPGGMTTLEGTAGFEEYLWSDNSTNVSLEVATPGIYSLTVTDENGCTANAEIEVIEDEALQPNIVGELAFCEGQNTTLDAGVFDNYNWSNGDTTQTITVDAAGEYFVVVSDGSGCEGMDTVSVAVNPNPEVQISGSATICPGGMTTLEGTAGFDEYLWSDNTTNASLEVATPGIYSLTVTDENGCMGNAEIEVIEDQALQPNIVGELAFCEGQNTTLDAGVFDNYNWSNGDTTQTITVDAAGEYFVVVSDGSGCEGVDTVSVAVNPNPEVQISGSATICPGGMTTLEGTAGFEAYLWSDNTTNASLEVATPGIYSLTVTDENGCMNNAEIEVIEDEALQPNIVGELAFCEGQNTTLDAGVFDNYNWSNGDTTQTITVDAAGEYFVLVSDGSGCEGMDTVSVVINPNPEVQISGSATICPGGMTTLEGTAGFEEYLWSDNSTNGNLEVATPGIYGLTVTDAHGCMGNAEIEVMESNSLEPLILGNLELCLGDSTELDAGIFADYLWSTGDTTQHVTIVDTGTYSVTVSDGSGCSGEDSVTVAFTQGPVANSDFFTIPADGDGTLQFNLLLNDILPTGGNYRFRLLSNTAQGTLDSLGQGTYVYQAAPDSFGEESFTYEVCDLDCPGACTQATVLIRIERAVEDIEVPNAITPNGDGINDTFVFDVLTFTDPTEFPDNRLLIFNRWGDVVFEQRNYDNTWNGVNNNGDDLPHATYYYILYLHIGESLILRGDITILGE